MSLASPQLFYSKVILKEHFLECANQQGNKQILKYKHFITILRDCIFKSLIVFYFIYFHVFTVFHLSFSRSDEIYSRSILFDVYLITEEVEKVRV